ncbi:ABC transporter ATP-binding protein [Actinotalea sp. K2]|uniref:ABC transporter ATP-binding protein n=1 Tax=Actinotalea sp. K2 TaxID=2939438 RepID=UPI002018082D|nr:ABC transporter ATP-binding protein [Actinotalea sp. K2]MCL3861114.1 ABC transporter ATP-binding protein [Actinotalea sp. K2]
MTTTQQTHDDLSAGHAAPVLAELLSASKQFGSGAATVQAVRGLDLEVRPGELLALLGPNGAGKSTAIGMLTGLTAPTSGRARLFGRDPRDVRARRRLGVMLQASGVPQTLRVRELLTEFRGYYPAPLPMAQVVTAAGLDGLEGRMFGELSGGQQRRVLFGITLAGDPDLLVFDEPTTGLDVEARRGLWATLRDLARSGRGVVLTTHYLEEADAQADRIVVIDRGVVIAQGTPAEIKAQVPGRRVRAQTSVSVAVANRWPGVARASREGPWLELLTGSAEPALRALLDLDPHATGVTVAEPSLEEAFLALTTDMEAAR